MSGSIRNLIRALLLIAGIYPLGTLAFENAQNLPQGRSRLFYVSGISQGITHEFDSGFAQKSITEDFNISLSAKEVGAYLPEISSLITALNLTGLRYDKDAPAGQRIVLSSEHPLVGDAIDAGLLGVDAKAYQQQHVISYAYGISDQITVGFGIPIVKAQVKVGASISGNNSAAEILQEIQASNPSVLEGLQEGLSYVSGFTVENLQTLLTEQLGYNRLQDLSQTGIGDVLLGGRYNYFDMKDKRQHHWLNTLQIGVVIPTGRIKDPADLTGMDFGGNAWNLALSHIVNFQPHPKWRFSNSINYKHQLSGSREVRVGGANNPLPGPDTLEKLSESLGNKVWTSFGARYDFNSVFSVSANYEFFWKNADSYSGSQDPQVYSYLSDNTDRYLETLRLGVTFDSVQAFLSKKFPLPGSVSLNYYQSLRGRNSVVANFFTTELALYF